MSDIRPTISINGTSQQELLDQMTEARHALLNAVKVMKEALPHRRDYQSPDPEPYRLARAEAVRRIEQAQDLAEAYYQDAIALTGGTS